MGFLGVVPTIRQVVECWVRNTDVGERDYRGTGAGWHLSMNVSPP